MVRKHHKILSVILCIMLVVSAVCIGTMGASAASGDTIYVRANNGWTDLHCYMWNSSTDQNAAWPGVQMTKVADDVYSYTLTGDWSNVIFNNNGNGSNQTDPIAFEGGGKIYDLSAGTWSVYADAPEPSTTTPSATDPSSSTQPTTQPATTPSTGAMTVYCQNDANWSTVYCYMWDTGSSDANASWPGKPMTDIGGGVWTYVADRAYKNVIFNGGSDSTKTSDLTATGHDGYIYNNSTGTWEVYDTSSLRVLSFGADPASGIYVGTAVTLSTQTMSTTGATISTKISVTDSKGSTSVLSDFSTATSAVWLPEAVGTYTVNFEYKDTEGNENSRSLSLTVEDDSTLVKPVIKTVTPFNATKIELNQPCTVTVVAGGGHTGTNLLFYKYIVTDPNGNAVNIPYYTLNDSFTFTPSVEGVYTVQVYVESSDNSKVNKTYAYGVGVDVEPSSSIVIPTAPSTTPTPSTDPSTEPAPSTDPSTEPAPSTDPSTEPAPSTNPSSVPTPSSDPSTNPTGPVVTGEKGDANEDGIVNIDDVTTIQMYLAMYKDVTINLTLSDMDDNGIVDINDASLIQKKLAFIIS